MVRRVLIVAAALFAVACNAGQPPGNATNVVKGADVVSSTRVPMATATRSLSFNRGASWQPDQVVIADVLSYGGPKVTLTAPSGWQMIRDDATPTTRQSVYWHAIQANDPSTAIWTFSGPVDVQGAIVVLDNVAQASPVDTSSGKTGGGGDLKSESMTTSADGDLVLIFKAIDFSRAPLHSQVPERMSAVLVQENLPREYWILATWQSQNGTTEETEFSFPQLFSWVAAQIAIRHRSP